MKKLFIIFVLVLFYSCGSEDDSNSTNNNIPPNAPSLVIPSNGSTIVTQIAEEEVHFEWTVSTDPDNDVTGYHWYADTDPNFSSPFNQHSNTNNTSALLIPNQGYYWRVRALDSNNNWSDYSETWYFYLQNGLAPYPPTLIYPLNETECANDNITFNWNASADSFGIDIQYALYLSTTISFDSNLNIYPTNNTAYNTNLPQGTALYWKVEANNGSYSSFSEVRSLYTQGEGVSNTAPQIEYINPEDGAYLTTPVTLQWQGSDNETNNEDLVFKVYFSEVGESLQLIQEGTNFSQISIDDLTSSAEYNWAIYVIDSDGATSVGNVYTFTVN